MTRVRISPTVREIRIWLVARDYIRCNLKPRLFDFSSGGLRHALIEGMPGRMTWGCMMRIPRSILSLMESAYQSRLAEGYAEVLDDGVFHRGLVEAGARWNSFHVIHRLSDALKANAYLFRGALGLDNLGRRTIKPSMKAFQRRNIAAPSRGNI
jgi:hypothetical protein